MRIVLGIAAIVIVALAGYLASNLSVDDTPPAAVSTREPVEAPHPMPRIAVAAAPPALPQRGARMPAPDSFDRAKAVVEHARASRHWGDDDASQLKQLMLGLDDDQRAEILNTLIPAVNTREITVDVQGPLY